MRRLKRMVMLIDHVGDGSYLVSSAGWPRSIHICGKATGSNTKPWFPDRPYCDILVAIPATPSTHPIRHTQQVQAEEADVSAAARTYADPSKPVRCSQMQQACCSTQAESLRLGEGHFWVARRHSALPTFSRQFLLTTRL
ncbi:hypothetical protein BT69DRAFT_765540 [Atractiella rhizophila]|nr:hypothetical protein BT69DRAFT_765540 [Atractiella rhizophila]